MRTDFKFLNLCGGVYSQGNLIFRKNGKELLSPVGNRVVTYDLQRSQNHASAFECLKDVICMDLTDDEGLMIVVDTDGRGMFVNYTADVALEIINFKPGTSKVKFSKNGRYLAVVQGRQVQIWSTPPNRVLQYRSVHLLRRITVASGDITSIEWSPCSRYILIGSEDCAVRIVSMKKNKASTRGLAMKPHVTLAAHRCPIVNAFFSKVGHSTAVLSVASDRAAALWDMTDRDRLTADTPKDDGITVEEESQEEEDEEEEEAAPRFAGDVTEKNWNIKKKFFLEHDARLQVCEFAVEKSLLFAGFRNGVFGIYTIQPEVRCIHTLSITEQKITSVSVTPQADWVAFGSAKLGQLLVWEWKSETYVLKQQSHYHTVNTVTFSPDGAVLATSSDDGKVKVWNGSSGFCYATFRDHQGPVLQLRFSNNTTLWSASADGTIRGYDLKRYRQFKILQPPTNAQLSCLALDPSGELVVGGGVTENEVYLWSVRTGQLLDVFEGHEGPISGVEFHSSGIVFASGSWDKTVRIREVYADTTQKNTVAKSVNNDVLRFNSEVLAFAFSPDGTRLCVVTLNADVSVFDTEDTNDISPLYSFSIHRDVKGGWRSNEGTNPFRSTNSARSFNHISWSPDSSHIIMGGNSKWVCIYSAAQGFLLRKFSVTNNRSLDGMTDVYDHRADTEAGNVHNLDLGDSDSEDNIRKVIKLPGAQRGDQGKRTKTRPTARANAVIWSPTGKEWAAATTDGLLLFSTEVDKHRFNPVQLSLGLTPQDAYAELDKGNHVLALLKALRLNDLEVITRVLNGIPLQEITFVADNIPSEFLGQVLDTLAKELEQHRHLERYLRWSVAVLSRHGTYLQKKATATHSGAPADGALQASVKLLHQQVVKSSLELSKLAENSKHMLAFLQKSGGLEWHQKPNEDDVADDEEFAPQLGHAKRQREAERDGDAEADADDLGDAADDEDMLDEGSAEGGASSAAASPVKSPAPSPKKAKKAAPKKASAKKKRSAQSGDGGGDDAPPSKRSRAPASPTPAPAAAKKKKVVKKVKKSK